MRFDQVSLKRLFKVVGGSTPASDNPAYWDGPVTWVTPVDLGLGQYVHDSARTLSDSGYAACGTVKVPPHSLILSTRAPIGGIAIASKELSTNQGCKALVPREGVDSRYFYYQLSIRSEELNSLGRGSTFLELSASILEEVALFAPDIAAQIAIANFLDEQTARIDALIAEKEQLQVTLEELRQSELRFALTHGLDASAQLVPLGEQFIGAIPVHWRLLPWKRVGRFTGGAGFPVEYQGNAGEELPFFKVKDLETDNMLEPLTSSEHTVSRETAASLRATVFEAGTITFAKVGAALLLLRVRMLGASACLDNNMMAFIPNTDVVDPLYAQLGLGLLPLDWLVNPGAVPSVSASQVCEIKVAVPPLAEQRLITKYLASRFADMRRTVTHVSEHIARLREYRSSLISAAVTGQMDISTYKPH